MIRKIAGIAGGAALSAAAAAALGIYWMTFDSPHKGQDDDYLVPEGEQYEKHRERILELVGRMDAEPYEPVELRSRDGLVLRGKYYHRREGAPLGIFFHGFRSTALRDGCGGAGFCLDEGMNVLLVDQRAHCGSQGRTITYGVKEQLDCLDWVNWSLERFGPEVQIMLYGVSMGAATVTMAAGLELPENVRGIIADCPFASPQAIITKVACDMGLPGRLLYPLAYAGARVLGRFDPRKGDAAAAVRKPGCPVLIIHGDDDRFVPCEMSEEIRLANPERVRRELIPNAGHAIAFLEDEERYKSICRAFMAEVLKQ